MRDFKSHVALTPVPTRAPGLFGKMEGLDAEMKDDCVVVDDAELVQRGD